MEERGCESQRRCQGARLGGEDSTEMELGEQILAMKEEDPFGDFCSSLVQAGGV